MLIDVEVTEWGADNSVRIAFWDSEHGDDRFFVLLPDGTAQKVSHSEVAGEVEGELDREEYFTPCNLVLELRALLAEITARRKAERG